jgi:hypothetical protein
MAELEFVRLLRAVRDDADLLARYDARNLAQLLLHARNDGYDFDTAEAENVIGRLEYDLITVRDGQSFDGSAALWRDMWGRRYLGYLVAKVVSRYGDDELAAVGLGLVPA